MLTAVICDDETATMKIISYFISNEMLPIKIVGTAVNGRDSLRMIRQKKPKLAFMDIQMPNLNGFEVIERLKENDTKIIIVTVYDTFAYAQKALRLGACDIISKPIDLEQLRQAIARAVGWNYTSNESLNRALSYIHNNYNKKIELDTLAKEACCTKSHIAHIFKKELGMSTTPYINQVRIKRAIKLIVNGTSIQETAYAVGYASLNNFYKYFKLYTGETPASYVSNK